MTACRFARRLFLFLGYISYRSQLCPVKANEFQLPSVDRIVGGSPIDITKVPYMLSFMVNGDHVCGAGIIGREWGITAAHCVIEFIDSPYNFVSVRSGSNRHDYGGIVHNVTYMSYHEKYDSGNNDYDIAVFKVDPFFRFNNVTQPANLPENSRFYDTDWGLVAGWGDFIDFDPVLSNNLQYVIVPKVCRKLCAEDYRNRYEITDRQVCYGFQDGGKDSCKGDSGGPLVTKNFTMIGITSWGDDCGKPNSPGVYTDVIGLVDWVKNKTTV